MSSNFTWKKIMRTLKKTCTMLMSRDTKKRWATIKFYRACVMKAKMADTWGFDLKLSLLTEKPRGSTQRPNLQNTDRTWFFMIKNAQANHKDNRTHSNINMAGCRSFWSLIRLYRTRREFIAIMIITIKFYLLINYWRPAS